MIEIYNKQEENIINDLSNIEIQSFSTLTFNLVGYPHKINNADRLIHYLDTMHENNKYLNDNVKIDKVDEQLVTDVLNFIENFSYKKFKRKITPIYSLLAAYDTFKTLEPFIVDKIKKNKKIKIFEIGPGSSILALLLLFKYKEINYASTDNSQAFYILQSNLYKEIDENYSEHLVENQDTFFNEKSNIAHVPWWVLLKNKNLIQEEFDIVFCDHALAEMNRYCLSFYLKISSKFFNKSYINKKDEPYFIYCSLGKLTNNKKNIFLEFQKNNFFLFYLSNKINIFSIKKINLNSFNFLKKLNINSIYENGIRNKFLRFFFKFVVKIMFLTKYKNLQVILTSFQKKKSNQSLFSYITKRKVYYSNDHHFLNL